MHGCICAPAGWLACVRGASCVLCLDVFCSVSSKPPPPLLDPSLDVLSLDVVIRAVIGCEPGLERTPRCAGPHLHSKRHGTPHCLAPCPETPYPAPVGSGYRAELPGAGRRISLKSNANIARVLYQAPSEPTPNAVRSEVHGPPRWPSDIEM